MNMSQTPTNAKVKVKVSRAAKGNPLNPTPADLIQEQQRILAGMEKAYPVQIATGAMSLYTAQLRIACHEATIKLLRRHIKDPQSELFPAHIHKQLPSCAVAMVPLDASPELLGALDEIAKLAMDNDPDLYTTFPD